MMTCRCHVKLSSVKDLPIERTIHSAEITYILHGLYPLKSCLHKNPSSNCRYDDFVPVKKSPIPQSTRRVLLLVGYASLEQSEMPHLFVKAAVLKQQIPKFYPQILSTDAFTFMTDH